MSSSVAPHQTLTGGMRTRRSTWQRPVSRGKARITEAPWTSLRRAWLVSAGTPSFPTATPSSQTATNASESCLFRGLLAQIWLPWPCQTGYLYILRIWLLDCQSCKKSTSGVKSAVVSIITSIVVGAFVSEASGRTTAVTPMEQSTPGASRQTRIRGEPTAPTSPGVTLWTHKQ